MAKNFSKAKTLAALAVTAVAGGSLAHCAGPEASSDQTGDHSSQVGSVELRLQGTGVTLHSLDYAITGPSGFKKSGTVGVTSSSTFSALFGGLPAGNGFTITLTGTATNGTTTCVGSATFNVQPGKTSTVNIGLDCHELQRTGSVSVNGVLNVCPNIDDLTVVPAEVKVGSSVSLSSTAHDSDKGPSALTYAWTATGGTLDNPASSAPTFTCTAPGAAKLSLSVSDGDPAASCAATASATVTCTPAAAGHDLSELGHLVVIYLENHSFDNLYGSFPGAEGLPANAVQQIDFTTGQPFSTLPQVDPHVPTNLPNAPFDITQYVPANQKTVDLVHRYYQEQMQIDNGKMDGFVSVSDAKGLSFGYYPTSQVPLAKFIQDHASVSTLCDHFFHAAFGGSFLNHQWLIAAASPTFPNAPASVTAVLNPDGTLKTDGFVTPDGFAVNTAYSVNQPHPATTAQANLVPNQTNPTIGDRLNDAGVDWAWYSGGWNDALAGHADSLFQFHHQPFAYYANYADGTALKAAHLKDETDFAAGVAAGKLPPVSFVKPIGANNEHPGYADLITGENHTIQLIQSIMNSPLWSDTAIIVTYDEHGGFWDHVSPPVVDKWGPGERVPTIVISPFAKGGIDSTVYDTTAILKLIEKWWNLPALSTRDAAQADLSTHALKFN